MQYNIPTDFQEIRRSGSHFKRPDDQYGAFWSRTIVAELCSLHSSARILIHTFAFESCVKVWMRLAYQNYGIGSGATN